ncbi:MAG: NAD-dependent succinate-semialdehyde dehydrogenase [Treponema sp.]|nr:NAD-dependent succinate-semialdehyde dehydrogenase [Treponema sp.]
MYLNYINGELLEGEGKEIDVYNPETGRIITKIKSTSVSQAITALEAAKKAFVMWSGYSLGERWSYISRFLELLRAEKENIVKILIEETGKPLSNADYDFEMLPSCLSFFMEEAKRMKGEIIPDETNSHLNMIVKQPLGVVVGFLAWNFPLLNLGYKLGPVLASGCTCVIKPSSNTPLASLYVGSLARKAGIPGGVINIIAANDNGVKAALCESTIPKMLTLIGSSSTGREIIKSSATSIKHFSLELGGNAPAIVMPSADIEKAAAHVCDNKFGNCGQVCVAANRIFVHKSVKDRFIGHVLANVKKVRLGSGNTDPKADMGPMISKKACDAMAELVKDAVNKGAKVLCGGKKAERDGFFFEPTVLDNVHNGMRVYDEEIFGPIMPIIEFGDGDDIAVLGNDTEYGLASYLFTKDLQEAIGISRRLDFGSICVNEPFYAFNLPHGGLKESGMGKDCSHYSMEEYYAVKRISIKN